MPAFYDETTKSWFCKFYYQDYTGARKQKKKRGFKLQRDAKEWERSFLEKQQGSPNMTFQALSEIYMEDAEHRMRKTSITGNRNLLDGHILPYFKDLRIDEIKPATIRAWQNDMLKKDLSDSYLRRINILLSTVLNYAVKYHGLQINPARPAGKIGSVKNHKMDFYTKEEFEKFISSVNNPEAYTAFLVLYWTGLRIGELFALTYADVDLKAGIIHVTKSLQRIGGQDVITPPKTEKSTRDIMIHKHLIEIFENYIKQVYDPADDNRIFPSTKALLYGEMKRACARSGIKQIRIHDFRHSHASLLIELGFSPLLIAERLGHEDIKTTLQTYSHLYPNKQNEVVQKFDSLK